MIKIMLVRHGITTCNAVGRIQGNSDEPLSAEGLHQAHLLAAHFPFFTVDAIYASPLERAETTAKILAEKFNLHVQTVQDLREFDFGVWEGKVLRELAKTEPENFEKFFMQPDELRIQGAETFAELQERGMKALNKIIDNHKSDKDAHIVIVAHGAINRVILCSLLEIPIKKMWSLSQFNTGVNIFREDDGHFTIDVINSTAHLY